MTRRPHLLGALVAVIASLCIAEAALADQRFGGKEITHTCRGRPRVPHGLHRPGNPDRPGSVTRTHSVPAARQWSAIGLGKSLRGSPVLVGQARGLTSADHFVHSP
jgi:hypothetical protein